MLTFIQSTGNTESSTSVHTIFKDFLAHNFEVEHFWLMLFGYIF